MKLAYFPNHVALNAQPVLTAFLNSCKNAGFELLENSSDADAAVIWSVTWAGRLAPNKLVYDHYRSTGRPVIVLEVGALRRGLTWKIAVNNITADGFYGHKKDLDFDRPVKLGLHPSPNFVPKPSILIVAQNNRSLQVENLESVEQWVARTVTTVQTHSDRPIVVRPHPRNKLNLAKLGSDIRIEQPRKLVDTYDSFDIDYQHHVVINHNSGAGIQAAIAGAPVVVDSTSLAYPVSTAWHTIEQPARTERYHWLTEISNTEYLLNEIEQGLWIPRLAPALPL
jgi:hypothetical protein